MSCRPCHSCGDELYLLVPFLRHYRNQIFFLSIVAFLTVPKDKYANSLATLSEEKRLVGEEGALVDKGLQSHTQVTTQKLHMAFKWCLMGLLVVRIKKPAAFT